MTITGRKLLGCCGMLWDRSRCGGRGGWSGATTAVKATQPLTFQVAGIDYPSGFLLINKAVYANSGVRRQALSIEQQWNAWWNARGPAVVRGPVVRQLRSNALTEGECLLLNKNKMHPPGAGTADYLCRRLPGKLPAR
jgi:hypothetical protein